jgi:hypothetical protein
MLIGLLATNTFLFWKWAAPYNLFNSRKAYLLPWWDTQKSGVLSWSPRQWNILFRTNDHLCPDAHFVRMQHFWPEVPSLLPGLQGSLTQGTVLLPRTQILMEMKSVKRKYDREMDRERYWVLKMLFELHLHVQLLLEDRGALSSLM